MKKRLGKILIGGIIGVFFCCTSVLAISKTSVIYHFFSKKVAVDVQYYTKQDGKMVPFHKMDRDALPGEYISRIPIIQNEGMDCYIRAKVMLKSEKEPSIALTFENMIGLDEKWLSIGEYLYYEDVLLEDEIVKVFEGICLPEGWITSQDSGNKWEICVKVDAIQAKYFIPDYQSQEPWGEQKEGIEIMDAKEEEALEDSNGKGEVYFTIESETKNFQIEKRETFQAVGGFVPGDTKAQEITIQNLDKKERILYMSLEISEETKLSEEMELSIIWNCENEETILYQGSLWGVQQLLEKEALRIPGNGNGRLYVKFSLPKEVDNSGSAYEGSMCLRFSEDKSEVENNRTDKEFDWSDDTAIFDDTEILGNTEQFNDVKENYEFHENSTVQTGDDSKIWNGFVGLCIGICLFFLSLWKGKRGSYD